MSGWEPVVEALLGSWPTQVTGWGREGIAGYCAELEARGLSPDVALAAIRRRADRFPPSAGELAAEAHTDPDRPTFEELLAGLYGPGGLFGFRRSSVSVSPWVLAFADDFGRERLRMLDVDGEDGKWRRRELAEAWERFVEARERRGVALLARSGRGSLGRPDLAGVLGGRAQIESGRPEEEDYGAARNRNPHRRAR